MSKLNDRIISDLKSRGSSIDKKYGKGSTKKMIEFSTNLSALYDERIKVLLNQDLSKEEKIKRLSGIKERIGKFESEF